MEDKIQKEISKLVDSQIVGFYIDSDIMTLRMDFGFSPDEKITSIELSHIYHLLISKFPGAGPDYAGEERSFIALEIYLHYLDVEKRREVLSSLAYMHYDGNGNVAIFPDSDMYHLHVAGDICIDVVCGEVKVLKEI